MRNFRGLFLTLICLFSISISVTAAAADVVADPGQYQYSNPYSNPIPYGYGPPTTAVPPSVPIEPSIPPQTSQEWRQNQYRDIPSFGVSPYKIEPISKIQIVNLDNCVLEGMFKIAKNLKEKDRDISDKQLMSLLSRTTNQCVQKELHVGQSLGPEEVASLWKNVLDRLERDLNDDFSSREI